MSRQRSPNYPAVSLPEAIELVTKLYQREKRAPVDPERAALAWGYSSLSGPPRTKIAALRKYGLVDDTSQGLRVSDRALTILNPLSGEEKSEALRDAALEPALFRELSTYPGASDENLVARLVRTGFTEAGAKIAVTSYRETMSLAGPEASEYHPDDDRSEPVLTSAPETRRSSAGASSAPLGVTLKGGVRVELRFPEGEMTSDVVETLRSFFEWSEKLRPRSEVQDASPASPDPEREPTAPLLLPERSPTDAQS